MQRKIKEESYTYQMGMDELRRQLAEDHLRRKKLRVKEIAYLSRLCRCRAFMRPFRR